VRESDVDTVAAIVDVDDNDAFADDATIVAANVVASVAPLSFVVATHVVVVASVTTLVPAPKPQE
jgi:hypothetical protein